MKFNKEQIEIIEAARPAWEGLMNAGTINMGTMAMSNLKDLYNATFGMSGKNPEWSHGCIDCVIKCMKMFYAEPIEAIQEETAPIEPVAPEIEAASIASDEQPEEKPVKKGGKKSTTKK